MNRKEALYYTYLIWLLVAKNGYRGKPAALNDLLALGLITENQFNLFELNNHCPCCAYVEEKSGPIDADSNCMDCPLVSLWTAKPEDKLVKGYGDYMFGLNGIYCENSSNPIYGWWAKTCNTKPAEIIYKAAYELYRKM